MASGESAVSFRDNFISFLLQHVDVGGKTVLEIGSDGDLETIKLLRGRGAKSLIASNMDRNYLATASGSATEDIEVRVLDGREAASAVAAESIDLVFGVALLEHINDPDTFFSQMHAILRPGGVAVFAGCPMWSCRDGHHVYLIDGETQYLFNDQQFNPIPDWGHLYLDPSSMMHLLRDKGVSRGHIYEIVHQIYFGANISRIGIRQMQHHVQISPFKVRLIEALWPTTPPPDLAAKLKRCGWTEEEVTNSGLQVVMDKA